MVTVPAAVVLPADVLNTKYEKIILRLVYRYCRVDIFYL